MEYKDFFYFLQHLGTDPSRLIFEDELTGIYNRRFLLNYMQYKVSWDSPENLPVSLLMMDLDYFKEINDTYGHEIGDKVLIWVAELTQKVSNGKGLAVRYGGDEFMILMPGADKEAALDVGEALMQQIRENPIQLDSVDDDFRVTLSVGVASTPEDARSGEDLIRKADTALYYAKRFGRDKLAGAEQVVLQDVFPKTSLHQLDKAKITARNTQLIKVSGVLKKFGQGHSQFLIIEGSGGMGKTEFLKTIRQGLPGDQIWQVAVNGIPQELFRPYYMTTTILLELLNQQPDHGKKVLEDLNPKEVYYLTQILPQLLKSQDYFHQEDERTLRKQTFFTVVRLMLKLLDSRPIILLIDDLHCSDEATLVLFRRLLLDQDVQILICGTATRIHLDKVGHEPVPLEQFFNDYRQELDIHRLKLTPLSAKDIASHFQKIFPHVSLPENFEEVLAQLTQGNPLFINGIIRKLILDGKVALTGQQWVIKPLEDGYLPNSLEEVVRQKITALDEEGQKLLEHAATFGENVSLSVLAGGSERIETKIHDFIDRAVEQGLIGSEFHVNDETIRFLSHRVLNITYGAIKKERKKELHEQIGTYQEILHNQRLLSSAASIAYHFQLSANRKKARYYRELLQANNKKIFNAQEATHYIGEDLADAVPEEVPLDPSGMAQISGFIRTFLTAVNNIKLYPPGSSTIVGVIRQLKETIDKIMKDNEHFSLSHLESILMANGEPVDVSGFESIASSFVKLLSQLELNGVIFSKGLMEKELTVMLESLSRVSKKIIDRNFWRRFSREQHLIHIELKQVRYTPVKGTEETSGGQEIREEDQRDNLVSSSTELLVREPDLGGEDLDQVSRVIRYLLTAAGNIKLYPSESRTVSTSIKELRNAIHGILADRPSFTLSRVGNSLLANGTKIDTAGFKTMADAFIELLSGIGLASLTFLKNISSHELQCFIKKIGNAMEDEMNGEYWQYFSREEKLSGILFNRHIYRVLEEQVGLGSDQTEIIEEKTDVKNLPESQPSEDPEVDEAIFKIPFEAENVLHFTENFIESTLHQLKDAVLDKEKKKSQRLVNQLFQNFEKQTLQTRTKIIHAGGRLFKELDVVSKAWIGELITDPLLSVVSEEGDLELRKEISALLFKIAYNFIRFDNYQSAGKIYRYLGRCWQQPKDSQTDQKRQKEMNFTQELDSKTREILLTDLKSQDANRLQQATDLLGSLGAKALPLLIQIIKKEDDLRLRQIAANMLGDLGPESAEILRRELVLDSSAEDRVRILGVIDDITRNLKTELTYAFADESPKVRQAAFHLATRLNNEDAMTLLKDYAGHEDTSIAVFAIKSLGQLKIIGAVDVLISLLESTKDSVRLIACCRALGQIADPLSIESLAKILAPGGFFSLRKKKNNLVRATAAFALSQIDHPRAEEVLALYVKDREPRVRQAARDRVSL